MFAKVEHACYEIIRKDLFPEFLTSKQGNAAALTEHLKSLAKLHLKEKKSQRKSESEGGDGGGSESGKSGSGGKCVVQ